MDRKIAEVKLQQFIERDYEYSTAMLYGACRRELCWNCRMCNYDDFMKMKAFRIWINEFDWLEHTGKNSKGESIYMRKDSRKNPGCKFSKHYEKINKILCGVLRKEHR